MNKPIKIAVVGDIFPSNTPYTCGFGNGSIFLKDKGVLWERILSQTFKEADISFANLESALIEDDETVNSSSFAGSTLFAQTLKNIEIDIVSIANNHILEQGLKGFTSTQQALTNAGILYVGVFNDYKSNIVVIEKNNLKFGFAAFNAIKDIPNNKLHADLELKNVRRSLDEMHSKNIDYKLLSFHWGNEYIHIPSPDQIQLAHAAIDYGADVIIGHHPHVVQPIERYKKGLIIYSLGNFIFDFLFSRDFKTGMKVDLIFKKDKEIEYSISEVKLNETTLNTISISDEFNEKATSYLNQMVELQLHDTKYYNKHYKRVLEINHFYQRILMKVKLIKLLLFSSNKKFVFVNIIKEIF